MARIRTIKPDAFTSDSLSSVPRGTRWTFAGLWTYADDAGRGRDDPRLIKAALYPIDDDTTLVDVADDLDMLHGIGAICRYEVGGRRYLHMPKWGHQKINRPTPPKSPPCPLHEDGNEGEVIASDPYVSPHPQLTEDSLSPQRGKGREGKGIGKDTCASADAERGSVTEALVADFDEWYGLYPRKKSKGAASRAYRAARKKASHEELMAGLRQALPDFSRRPAEKIPYPATWLNAEAWLDEQLTAPSEPEPVPSQYLLPNEITYAPSGMTDEEADAWAAQQARRT